MKLDCVGLANEARSAHGELVAPDRALTVELDSAYRSLFAFATQCYSSGGVLSSAELALLRRGQAALADAERRYGSLESGSTPPSTAPPTLSQVQGGGGI